MRAPLHGVTLDGRPIEPEVPFPKAARSIALRLQVRRQSCPITGDQCRGVIGQHFFLQIRTPGIATGQQSVTSGSTDGRWRVRVRKPNALIGDAVYAASLDGRFRVITTGVAPAKIVRQDQNDIRVRRV